MPTDARQARGQFIADHCKVTKLGNEWFVPSQSGGGKYIVRLNPDLPTCTCPDYELREMKCKHIFAVEYTIKRQQNPDGSTTVTERVTVSETIEKKTTYKQNWPAYNAAQSVEKDRVQELLFDLCQGLQEPKRTGKGRKPHCVKDSIFAMVYKVYSTFSSRRFSTDLRDAHERGYLSRHISGMKSVQFMEDADFTPILKNLIHLSSLPLRAVETKFAIDSSGFSSSKFERWFDHKYGVTRQKCLWVKVHIACGVKTNIVTAVRILDKDAGDCPQFVPLLQETKEGFTIGEVSADKAYASLENFEYVAGVGGEAFIAFKSNTTGAVGGHFEKAFHYFSFKREEYLTHYHLRSNVESTFSMIKRKFGDAVRSKTDVAMVNEALCKILAHNLCVLIQEEHELGIDPIFWNDTKAVAGALMG
jgi:transposase